MTYSIPISEAMRAALSDHTKRYIKVTVTHDGSPVVFYPTKISGNASEEFQSWNVQLKNYGEYSEGLFADDLATVSFSHNNSEWVTLMTGYVSPEGMNREQGYISDDIVSFDLVDRTKGKGTKRKPSSAVYAALKICDPSDASNSILHRLGSLMGITSFDAGLIQDVKDIVTLGEQVVWSELKLLRDAYKACLYFDYLGRLRFHSPLETGWTDPESEWTFVADPSHTLDAYSSRVIGKVRRTYNQVSCNRATSNLNLYEQRSLRVVYRDTTNWNGDLSQCSIVIQPGATYPESGVLSLNYKDPLTGEEYPYATNVQTPTIGQSKTFDIAYSGGYLELISFNGSTSATTQQPGASQIILKNTGALACEIIKFEVRGEPFFQLSENKVEEVDSSISDEVDYVDLPVDGKYATSVEQIDKVLSRHVEEGKIRTRHFSFASIFLPQIQREMACTYIDVDGSEIACKVTTYSHKASGKTLDTMRTYVELDEVLSYTPSYNPKHEVIPPNVMPPQKGENGAPARTLSLYADSSVIALSSRGELRTQQIEITLVLANLPIESAIWTSSDGDLVQVEIAAGVFDPYRRVLDCATVEGDSSVVTVSIVHEGQTYSYAVGFQKYSEGIPNPLYLDAPSTVPSITSEGPLVSGDFFLYTGPYSGPNSDPGDQGLNPPALEINEFVYGRIYEYLGKNAEDEDQWKESRKSEHLAAAQKDALQIAKDSNTYMFVAVLVAQLGLFFDLIVAGVLKSPNYAENASGVPTAGFKLDGIRGLIKALGLEAYEAMIYGNLQASGFKTLQEEAGTPIATASITPTLWKHSEMEALIANQDSLTIVSGVINGFVFARAVRRANKRILQRSTGYEYEAISAGEEHFFTWLTPDIGWGMQCYVEYSGYYQGNYSYRRYIKRSGAATGNLPTSYSRAYIENIDWAGQEFCCWHKSEALFDFGAKPSYVNYHNIWTPQIFTGIVLTTEPVLRAGSPGYGACYDFNYLEIPPEPTAYYPNTKTWTIGAYNQNSIANYCSGTDFYNLFSSLAIGADGFCDGGQINVNGTLYTVTRLTKAANSITFYTSGGVITVTKFQEGTNVGVYTELAVTQAINFQAVVGGIEVKHIFPWGTQAGSPGTYDIGTANERFNTAYLNYLDALKVNGFRVQQGNDTHPQGSGGSIPVVATDGGLEVGSYIDFHATAGDYSARVDIWLWG